MQRPGQMGASRFASIQKKKPGPNPGHFARPRSFWDYYILVFGMSKPPPRLFLAALTEKGRARDVALLIGVIEGRVAGRVLEALVRPGLEQRTHDLDVSLVRSNHERGAAALGEMVDWCPGLD